ncbi:prolyl aminopeptidase [Cognatishimia activa]|uniref:Proline iminopeptidase n=1 Tax=Cognatishimia activa TaxID=1715691 RepID=A0A975ESK4_9RHOB|nr:prolyl aminopeptidase [Cognatishimia activa]QTN37057.1 prolyl aminopeptidase [Cognatishimia activa]
MDKHSGQKRAVSFLYPLIEPFDQRMMDMGDGHQIYVEQSGNPNGTPVVVFHGGPGGGCSPTMRRYFDPEVYRVVLFDQRGCGRSKPQASIENNTTWHLIADIERIRAALGIEKWVVFGGSWGATLALLYAQAHPDRPTALVLRGVFAMTRAELDWFYGGGAAQFFPETWTKFANMIPEDERVDMIAAYHKRLFSGNRTTEVAYARAWAAWENALASVYSDGSTATPPAEYAHAFSRLENHYFINAGFLEQDGQIFENMDRIAHIPGYIVQGRYDMICPPHTAQKIADLWPGAHLSIIRDAGHALSEPGISAELVRTMDSLART